MLTEDHVTDICRPWTITAGPEPVPADDPFPAVSLFPTDVPAGPSTTLHEGHVVYTVEAGEVFTVQEVCGKTTDICAILSDCPRPPLER